MICNLKVNKISLGKGTPLYLHMDETGPSLQQLFSQQMFQQLIFQRDLERLVLKHGFLIDRNHFDSKFKRFLDSQINPLLFFASEEFRYNRDKLDRQSDQRLGPVRNRK